MFDMEQALYIVQSLQPTGVGARSLTECLLLQLAQGKNFNVRTVRAARDGLELIAKNDAAGLAKLLSCTKKEAQTVAGVIRNLNPIPSRGYGSTRIVPYQIPEATVWIENGQLCLELNRRFLPRLSINQEISSLFAQDDESGREYLKKNTDTAMQLIRCVENRQSTMERLLQEIVRYQQGFFLHGTPLKAMTMGELAERLGVSVSTVSRSVHGKSIVFQGRTLPIRDLFTVKLTTAQGEELSSAEIKRQISRLIQNEDSCKPLSDESIRLTLGTMGFPISRRTVAKYRDELGIPGSSQRRQR